VNLAGKFEDAPLVVDDVTRHPNGVDFKVARRNIGELFQDGALRHEDLIISSAGHYNQASSGASACRVRASSTERPILAAVIPPTHLGRNS
jgi:hypothetical protein